MIPILKSSLIYLCFYKKVRTTEAIRTEKHIAPIVAKQIHFSKKNTEKSVYAFLPKIKTRIPLEKY